MTLDARLSREMARKLGGAIELLRASVVFKDTPIG